MPTREEKLSNIPESLRNNHRFCEKCGGEMTAGKIKKAGLHNRRTGEKLADGDVYVWQCKVGADGHDYVEV